MYLKVILVTFVVIFTQLPTGILSLKADKWYPSYYNCEKHDGEVLMFNDTIAKPGQIFHTVTDELYLESDVSKIITCIKVRDNWGGDGYNGYVSLSHGGLLDAAILLKFKSQLGRGFSFDVTVYQGDPSA